MDEDKLTIANRARAKILKWRGPPTNICEHCACRQQDNTCNERGSHGNHRVVTELRFDGITWRAAYNKNRWYRVLTCKGFVKKEQTQRPNDPLSRRYEI